MARYASLTVTALATLVAARSMAADEAKAARRRVWAQARAQYGVPTDVRFVVEIDDRTDPLYGVLLNKHTRVPLRLNDEGRYTATPAAAPAPVVRMRQTVFGPDVARAILASETADSWEDLADGPDREFDRTAYDSVTVLPDGNVAVWVTQADLV